MLLLLIYLLRMIYDYFRIKNDTSYSGFVPSALIRCIVKHLLSKYSNLRYRIDNF